MLKWLYALMASSFTFALADVICDICITEAEAEERAQKVETAEDDDDQSEARSDAGIEMGSCTGRYQLEGQQTPATVRYKPLSQPTKTPTVADLDAIAIVEEQHEDKGLSGAQDAAVAGLVTVLSAGVSVVYWCAPVRSGASATSSIAALMRWRPTTHLQWWLAMVGGASNFLHYFFLLKAFESAPSTVILPLVQVASVSVLLGSSFIALYRHEPWITPTHALAYVLMFVGGILPACAGQLSALLERDFWRQSFVGFSVAAEFALGLHDLMLSGCSYNAPPKPGVAGGSGAAGGGAAADGGAAGGGASGVGPGDEYAESFEFFVWSRLSFIAMFAVMYLGSPTLWAELCELLSGKIERKYIGLSAISEGLTIVGFYLASIAYGLFYQAGIVHAAEASLSQLLNLLLAYLLLTCCGLGRASAVSSMRTKFVSFVMVTLGLFLCTFEGDRPVPRTVTPVAVPGQGPTALINAAGQAMGPTMVVAAQRVMTRRRARRL